LTKIGTVDFEIIGLLEIVNNTYGRNSSRKCAVHQPGGLNKTSVIRNVRRILVEGVIAPLPLKTKKILKIYYKMVHSEVYLNKYVVSIVPFSTPACPDCSQNIT